MTERLHRNRFSTLVILLVVFAACFAGCGSSDEIFTGSNNGTTPATTGDLQLQFDLGPGPAPRVDADDDLVVRERFPSSTANISIELIAPNGETLRQASIGRQTSALFEGLPLGRLLIRTRVFDAGGQLLGFNDTVVTITPGRLTVVIDTLLTGQPPTPFSQFPPRLAFRIHPETVTSGSALSVEVVAIDSDGFLINTFSESISLVLNGSGVSISGQTSANATSGVASFNSIIATGAGTGLTLTASSAGSISAVSVPFDVLASSGPTPPQPGTPTSLNFVSVTDGIENQTLLPPVQVEILDGAGQRLPVNSTVTLSLASDPAPRGVLQGTVSIAAVNGLATFADLSIDQFGFYRLIATSANLPDATSEIFQIQSAGAFLPGGRLFTAEGDADRIRSFANARGLTGLVNTATTLLFGAATRLASDAFKLGLDRARAELYCSLFNAEEVVVFGNAYTATGDQAPVRRITDLDNNGGTASLARALFYDPSGDRLYVGTNQNTLAIFDNASTKNVGVGPDRVVTGLPGIPQGCDYDAVNDRLFVVYFNGTPVDVDVFDSASTMTGARAGVVFRAIQLPNAGFRGIEYDLATDTAYIATGLNNSIQVVTSASTASGVVAPPRTLFGAATLISDPYECILDPTRNELYVFSDNNNQIQVFGNANVADGNTAPTRTALGWPDFKGAVIDFTRN